MGTHRLVDLAFNPNEPRDAHGRWVKRGGAATVALKDAAYVVNGKAFGGDGVALKASPQGGGIVAFMGKVQPKPPATPFNTFANLGGKQSLKPVSRPAAPKPTEHLDVTQAQAWYDTITKDDTDSDNLSTDLGLDPKLKERSIPELRRAIKDKRTKDEDRKQMKAEYLKRVAMQKAIDDEKAGFTNKLARRFEDAPEGADIAPIIGETLAEHPRLGPLAHIWDRLRLAGYNTKKHFTSKEFGDELPRIIARNVASVLVALLALHFGVMIPGVGPGSGG